MNLHELLNTRQLIPGDGSMCELLRRSPEVEFDDHIAHSGLIYNVAWARLLERVLCAYIDVEEPESFALANRELKEAHGMRVIGGCRGTSPAHIRAIARLV